ncbi:PiggyBac transposable element-derived protein 4 [Cucumispora dikerogammari]|nr:PiggyBac transposable element-derived protein 4 [Cucumispora dikerogammari]
MGLKKVSNYKSYWAASSRLLFCKIISKAMFLKRYSEINSNLTCISKSDYVEGRKIVNKPKILNRINKKFATAYSPSECLSIVESTIPFKGNVTFKVYNPNKPAKHGIKVHMCSDSKTGYIYKLKICSERSTLVEPVTDLLTDLENKWHKIFMDNFYNSFDLCKKLLESKFNVCGTFRVNRGGPRMLKSIKKNNKSKRNIGFSKTTDKRLRL